MMRYAVALVFALVASPAAAMTGAEFLKADRSFAEGYLYGVLHSAQYTFHNKPEHDARMARERECMKRSGMDNDQLYDLVARYIRNHPRAYPLPAFAAVLTAVSEMCGEIK